MDYTLYGTHDSVDGCRHVGNWHFRHHRPDKEEEDDGTVMMRTTVQVIMT